MEDDANKKSCMNRFEVFHKFNAGLTGLSNIQLKFRMNVLISPLYLYAIQCHEQNIEQRFNELSLSKKLGVFPKKVRNRFQQYGINNKKVKVISDS